MGFQISPLDANEFSHLQGLDDASLAIHGARRVAVDKHPGFPCRLSLKDAAVGETVLLVNYEHLRVETPYRSSHAIFISEHAVSSPPFRNQVPEQLRLRLLSIRAFDAAGMMVDADVVHGKDCEPVILKLLDNPLVDFLHIHNAKPGCYAARVDKI